MTGRRRAWVLSVVVVLGVAGAAALSVGVPVDAVDAGVAWTLAAAVATAAGLLTCLRRPATGAAVLFALTLLDVVGASLLSVSGSGLPLVGSLVGLYVVLRSPRRSRGPWLAATGVLVLCVTVLSLVLPAQATAGVVVFSSEVTVEDVETGVVEVLRVPPWLVVVNTLVGNLLVYGAVALMAEATRRRLLVAGLLRERAADLERLRHLEVAAAADRERTRLGRRTRLVLTDSVVAMSLQAAAGRRVLRERPRDAEAAFAAIEEAGRDALEQLRHVVADARTGPADRLAEHSAAPGAAVAGRDLRRPDVATALGWILVALAAAAALSLMVPAQEEDAPVSYQLGQGATVVVTAAVAAVIVRRPVVGTIAAYVLAAAGAVGYRLGVEVWNTFPLIAAAAGLYVVLRVPSRRRWPWLVATAGLVAVSASAMGVRAHDVRQELLNLGFWFLLVVVLAEVTRRRWVQVGVVEQRMRDAEALTAVEAEVAAAGERARIAREMHDVLAHTVMAMVVQAGAGRRSVHRRPDDADAAFAAVAGVARQALGDLRGTLAPGSDGPVRHGSGPAAVPVTVADTADVAALVSRAPVPASLVVEGTPGPLDPAVDLAAYRILQESLTNVAKHAVRSASVEVALRWSDHAVEITVTDDGAQGPREAVASGAGGGYGLLGMRERVDGCGGTVTAGPRADRAGWRVHAVLPRHPVAVPA